MILLLVDLEMTSWMSSKVSGHDAPLLSRPWGIFLILCTHDPTGNGSANRCDFNFCDLEVTT
jgi:hypothetical protein